MQKCDELSKLYLDVLQKERQHQKSDLSGQVQSLKMMLDEEKEKRELEHKRYVYCKQLVEHQEMEI
jgi:hypothetical protein